jgi:hypothetical protein
MMKNGQSGWAVDPYNASLIRFDGQAKLGLFGLDSKSQKRILRRGQKKISTFFVIFFFSETEIFFRFSFVSMNFVTFLFVSHLVKYFPFRFVSFLKKIPLIPFRSDPLRFLTPGL